MKINQNKLGATIDQQLYAKSIVNKLVKKGTDIFPRNTPLQPDITLTKKDCPTTPAIQQEIDAKYVGDKVCSGTECTEIKSSTTNTGEVQTDKNDTITNMM